MTPEEFRRSTGQEVRDDDLERANCIKWGEPGHEACGVCEEHGKPIFYCTVCFPKARTVARRYPEPEAEMIQRDEEKRKVAAVRVAIMSWWVEDVFSVRAIEDSAILIATAKALPSAIERVLRELGTEPPLEFRHRSVFRVDGKRTDRQDLLECAVCSWALLVDQDDRIFGGGVLEKTMEAHLEIHRLGRENAAALDRRLAAPRPAHGGPGNFPGEKRCSACGWLEEACHRPCPAHHDGLHTLVWHTVQEALRHDLVDAPGGVIRCRRCLQEEVIKSESSRTRLLAWWEMQPCPGDLGLDKKDPK